MTQKPTEFEQKLITEYFKHSSINQAFKFNKYNLPLSFASYHRILKKYQIIESAGPNSKLSESLDFLSKLASYKIPLEKLYHQYAPTQIQVSTNTLHRILHHVRLKVTRRVGTALLISQEGNLDRYLFAQDTSLNDPKLGSNMDYSLPMTHSKMQESAKKSILRVIQQEVFTDLSINNKLPTGIIPQNPKPVMYINIADIKVAVYRIVLPMSHLKYSSFRLTNYQYFKIDEISNLILRTGVEDILKKYEEIRFFPKTDKIPEFDSTLNNLLFAWCSKI